MIMNALRAAKYICINLHFLSSASLIKSYKDSVHIVKFFVKRL